MSPRSCLVSALLLCVHASASPVLDQHQTELREHYEHLAYIAEFPCHVPQARVITLHKMFPPSEIRGKAFFPDVTVLHRCDEAAGCCTQGRHCAPLQSETVTLPFKITFLEDIEKHKKGSWLIEYYDFQNHTRCDCLETPYSPDYTDDSSYSSSSYGSSYPPHTPSYTRPSTFSAFYSSTLPPRTEDSDWKLSPSIQEQNLPSTSSLPSRLDELKESLSSSASLSSSSSSQELSLEEIEQLLQSANKPEDLQTQSSRVTEIKNEQTGLAESGEVCEEDPK